MNVLSNSSKRRPLALLLAAALVAAGGAIALSIFVVARLTKVVRFPLERTPHVLGLEYTDVSFPSRDDCLEIHGWLIKAENDGRTVIMTHGEYRHRDHPELKMLELARDLHQHGYSVLMIDLRGHGESQGDRISAGYYEKRDVLGAIDYLKGLGIPSPKVALLGFSLGAATSILAAAEEREIGAVISDSSFANLKELLGQEVKRRMGLPTFFIPLLKFTGKIMYGFDPTSVSPIEKVASISPSRIFFIHGEKDAQIPPEHAYRLMEASGGSQNQMWIVPEAEHVRAYVTYPQEYVSRVVAFLDKVMG